jgi:cytochrome c peroxidase
MADPVALINAFDKFRAGVPPGGGQMLTISLVALRGITSESVNASGEVKIDLATGSVMSKVSGLPKDGAFDLWLLKNRPGPGNTTMAEAFEKVDLKRVGAYGYQMKENDHELSVTLGAASFATFLPDRAFVVRSNQSPLDSFVLTGSATIFDRLMRRQVRFIDDPGATLGFDPVAPSTRAADFAKLLAQGRQLFVNEQFNGNGRRCGTCHVESNNFTIDPDFISKLPPTDPLFVAETNPALAVNFEKPNLMRKLGVFLENVDGYDDLASKFILRSVQNVQALTNSTKRPDPSLGMDFSSNSLNADPPERLGWSNDGAPLLEFAIVAIGQHATRTLHRRPGVDFRVPTDQELDALAAYQLALGRQEDFNLTKLQLKSKFATLGQILYLDTGNIGQAGHKNCNACHFNAGGTSAVSFNSHSLGFPKLDSTPRGFNMGAPTNVNDLPLARDLGLPRDGGFGVLPLPNGGFGNFCTVAICGMLLTVAICGMLLPFEEFNTPPLVESADTAPFFHNHTVKDLESAIAFYGRPEFQSPKSIGNPNAIPIQISADPNDPEVQELAAFLRVLNALENIRSSINIAERGRTMASEADAHDLARLAYAETADAIKVLSAGALAKDIEPGILSARANAIAAGLLLQVAQYTPRLAIDNLLQQATSRLRAARSDLAEPATLPASFLN